MEDFKSISKLFISNSKSPDDPNMFAAVDGYASAVPGARSLFNPFNIFRYSKFGLNPNNYKIELHSDFNPITDANAAEYGGSSDEVLYTVGNTNTGGPDAGINAANQLNNIVQGFKKIKVREAIENPTASQIIEWTHLKSKPGEATAEGPAPYSPTDFLWCKWYGKIPNNRLITLRRYPLPIEDNLNIAASKMPLVPLSQAVTWFGQDTGNTLGSILKPSWGLMWTSKSVTDIQDIQGNEISVEDLLAALGQSELKPEVVSTIKALITGEGKVDIAKLSGFDKTIQEYVKSAYGQSGPYWNRILGPINVVNKTLIRDRGFKDNTVTPITLSFTYSLRSWGGVNPKIAFLDLYTNFLSLTFNTAPFWGGGARYFERTGVTLPSLGMEQKFFEGDVFGGIQVGMRELMELATTRFKTIVAAAEDLVSRGKGKAAGEDTDFTSKEVEGYAKKKELDENAVVSTIEKAFIPRLALLMQKPLLFRALLDGRAVGEWHLTVGNPMNPIANIGNLICDGCDVEFNDVLGIDDFPTEVTFKISLKHGRIRAKQDWESIFNSGNGAMSFSELSPPSSASNSYGGRVTAILEAVRSNRNVEDIKAEQEADFEGTAFYGNNQIIGRENNLFTTQQGTPVNYGSQAAPGSNPVGSGQTAAYGGSGADLQTKVKTYSGQVTKMYGEWFGKSNILGDYFKELKTKD